MSCEAGVGRRRAGQCCQGEAIAGGGRPVAMTASGPHRLLLPQVQGASNSSLFLSFFCLSCLYCSENHGILMNLYCKPERWEPREQSAEQEEE